MNNEIEKLYNKILLFLEFLWVIIFSVDILYGGRYISFGVNYFSIIFVGIYILSSIFLSLILFEKYKKISKDAFYYSSQIIYYSFIKPVFYVSVFIAFLKYIGWNFITELAVIWYIFVFKIIMKNCLDFLDCKYRENKIIIHRFLSGKSEIVALKYITIIFLSLFAPFYVSINNINLLNQYSMVLLFAAIPIAFLCFCYIKKYSPYNYIKAKLNMSADGFMFTFYTVSIAYFAFGAIPAFCAFFLIMFGLHKCFSYYNTIRKSYKEVSYSLEIMLLFILVSLLFEFDRPLINVFLAMYTIIVMTVLIIFNFKYRNCNWTLEKSILFLLQIVLTVLMYLTIFPFILFYFSMGLKTFAVLTPFMVFVVKEWNKYILDR